MEQEVTGDDTLALDSVLEADTVRSSLLKREKELLALNTAEAASELSDVYAELSEIEADKAPAIASVILAGLGFSPEGQKRATRTFSGKYEKLKLNTRSYIINLIIIIFFMLNYRWLAYETRLSPCPVCST